MAVADTSKRIKGYPNDPPREKEVLRFKTYEYDMPFNYANVEVMSLWNGVGGGGFTRTTLDALLPYIATTVRYSTL